MRMFRLFFYVFGDFQAPPIGLEYELQRVESFTMDHLDANIFETMPSKTETWPEPELHVHTPLRPNAQHHYRTAS